MQTTKSNAGSLSLGKIKLNRIGLGTNRITDNENARAVLKHAVSIGINFIDTADIYQSGNSEITIGKTLAPYPEDIVIATKGGMVRGADANNSPEHLQRVLSESLTSLKTNCITLYQLHRVNPKTPIKETVSFFKQMLSEGKIKYVGLSEVSVEQIEEARKTIEIATVQNRFSITERKHEVVVDYCEKHGIIFIPFFPLNSGGISSTTLENIAKKHEASVHQIALAWLLKRSPVMLPIPGTLSVKHLDDNLAALKIELSDEDFETLSK